MVIALFLNITILISSTVLYHFITRNLKGKPNARSVVNGLLLGATAILCMLTPFQFEQGIFYDTRSIVIGIAGFFGTPLTAIITTAIALAFRIARGGGGMFAGIFSILSAFVIASLGRRVRYRYTRLAQKYSLYPIWGTWLLGIIIHIFVVLSQFALPQTRWHEVIPLILFPYLGIYPLAFSLICLLFLDNEHIEKAAIDLAESEARYRSLFENHHTVMFIIDPSDGRIIDANPAAEAFYGWDRSTLKTMRISDINTRTPEEISAAMERARNQDNNIFYFKHRRANAPPIDVEVYSGPITIHGRELLYSIVHDNSHRIKAELDLKDLMRTLEQQVRARTLDLEEQTRKLTELNREYEAFVYSISHDLRAPLRAISGFSTILKDSMDASEQHDWREEAHHMIDRIQANTTHMQKLIDDMLLLSRVNPKSINLQPIDLSAAVTEVFGEIAESEKERNIELSVEPGLRANADIDLVRILLANLLSNAVKFTRTRNPARIEFGSEIRGNAKMFFIRDNGIGFDVTAAGNKLFAPFQRFNENPEFEGTGIGLSIVKRVIARHDGTVSVDSHPGEGTTFYFSFGEGRQV